MPVFPAVVTCPGLPAPGNGTVIVPNNDFGRNAYYNCNPGYTLTGDTMEPGVVVNQRVLVS